MKQAIIKRIKELKSESDNFKSKYWGDVFVSFTQMNINRTAHISEVDFDSLSDEDLVRLFEYVVSCRGEISDKRVQQIFFSKK